MISWQRFAQLGAGDLVYWVPGRYYRTVLDGPRDHGQVPARRYPAGRRSRRGWDSIELPIRHRSWCGRPTTTYAFTDIKHLIRAVPKSIRRLMTPEEAEQLERCGWAPVAVMAKEIADRFLLAERMRKKPCRSLLRARRLVLKMADS